MVAADHYAAAMREPAESKKARAFGLHVVQIAGRDPYVMRKRRGFAQTPPVMIDINMGCPRKRSRMAMLDRI